MSLWRWCIEVRLPGSCGRPASSDSDTGAQGGLAVVWPIDCSSVLRSFAYTRTEFVWQSLPWQGPIVTVV